MAVPSFLARERIVARPGFNRWLIPPAALAVHLCIGQAYATSVYKAALVKHFDTSLTAIGIIFSIAIVMLGLSAAVFGTWVDRNGPRTAMFTAACFWSAGFLVGSLGISTGQLWLVYLGYGVIGGIGLGIGYISPVSTLIKWFPDRPGLATGMAIMGFGGGALIASPISAAADGLLRPRLQPRGQDLGARRQRRRPAVPHPGPGLPGLHAVRRVHRPGARRRLEAGGLRPVDGQGEVAGDHGRASRRPTRSRRRSSGCCGSCCSATSPPASASWSRPRR